MHQNEKFLDFYKDKTILITGGAGFIGSRLARALVGLPKKLKIMDDFSAGKIENIKDFINHIEIIKESINSLDACKKALKNVDIIFHLAAKIDVMESFAQSYEYFQTNINGTLNLLEAARTSGTKKFIFSSSAAVYGNKESMCYENDGCLPESPYGLSKYLAEEYIKNFYKLFKVDYAILRYFNVYADADNFSQGKGVYFKFKYLIENDQTIEIYGDGLQQRDFINVDDIVKANMLAAFSNSHDKIFNVATGQSISILDLIIKISHELNKKPIIQFLPAKNEIRISQANISRYNNLINQIAF